MDSTDNTNTPFLAQWKTSAGAVVGGVVTASLLTEIVNQATSHATSYSMLVFCWLVNLVYIGFAFWYVLSAYPSLFGDKPKLTSSSAVSFLNGFFGWIIFGPLFSHNLTRGEKGISHIVLAVIWIVFALLVLVAVGAYL